MKKILTLLAIALAALTSCMEEVQYSISIDTSELSFSSAGGEGTVKVISTADWELSGDSYWCYASEYYGQGDAEIIFTADANEDSESSRSATFTFISGDKKATLTVTQEKKEYSISIEPIELTFGAEGGEQEIVVTSSDEWEVSGEPDWCYASVASGVDGDTVKFSVEPYMNTEEERTAIYTFVCGDKEAVLNIQQEAKVYSISVEPMELSFIAAGEEKTVTITSSDEWEFSSDEYWITASEQSGENGATVRIKVEENEDPEIRTGLATFKCGDKQTDVKITQEAKEFSISIEPKEIEFDAEGGEQTITVASSDKWELSTDYDWITTSTKSGENGSSVNINVGYTTSEEIRTGTVTFICGNKRAELTVTQQPDNSPIIQFKDPYFLEALLDEDATKPVIDKNGDGQISEKEAKSIAELSIFDSEDRVRNVDELSFFSSLESISISGYGLIEEFDLSNRTNLKSVRCSSGGFSSLNLRGCTTLTEIELYNRSDSHDVPSINTSLSSLDISGCSSLVSLQTAYKYSPIYSKFYEKIIADDCTSLKELKCQTKFLSIQNCTSLETLLCAGVNSLDLSDCSALKQLDCSPSAVEGDNGIKGLLKTLDLSNNTALTSLNCNSNELTSLDLSKNTSLTELECRYNQLTSLDLSNNTALTSLNCANNQLTSLDLSKNTSLTELYCNDNQLTSLDLSDCSALTSLDCYYNDITSLDISMCRNLKSVECATYNILHEIDLKSVCPLQSLKIYKYHTIGNMNMLEELYGDIIEYVE